MARIKYYNGTDWVYADSNPQTLLIDDTLTKSGFAADAKATGDAIKAMQWDESFTDAECVVAFINYMNNKATEMGMTDSTFVNASGWGLQENFDTNIINKSTPQDMLKLGVAACGYPMAMDIWGTPDRDFKIGGEAPEEDPADPYISSEAHISNVALDAAQSVYDTPSTGKGYTCLGAKGGNLQLSNKHRANLQIVDVDGTPVVVALMAKIGVAYENIYKSAQDLCYMVAQKVAGGSPTTPQNLNDIITNGGGYAACVLPNATRGYVYNYPPNKLITRENSVAGYSSSYLRELLPCSVSKTMTLLCALDIVQDLHEIITVKAVDIIQHEEEYPSSRSGSRYFDGAKIILEDALRIMMMESSNTLANAIARTCGRMLLTYKARRDAEVTA